MEHEFLKQKTYKKNNYVSFYIVQINTYQEGESTHCFFPLNYFVLN